MDFRDQRINVLGPLNKRYPNKRFYLFNDVNTPLYLVIIFHRINTRQSHFFISHPWGVLVV